MRAASAVLSLVCWIAGALVLRFSWRDNVQANRLGAVFLLASVVVTSWNATLMGVPLAWLTAQPLLFGLGVGWIYLGFLPSYAPFTNHWRRLFQVLITIALIFGVIGLLEGILLFPRGRSVQAVTGVSLYRLAALSQAIGGSAMFLILLVRRVVVTTEYVRHQLNILLTFVGLGFLPTVLFTFLPLALWGQPLLPMPVAIVALILVPLGYIYVVLRHAYLGLDRTVGRVIPYLLLVMLFTAAYSLILATLANRYGDRLNLVLPAVLLFVCLAALAPLTQTWLDTRIHALFFGKTPDALGQLRRQTGEIGHQPDLETVERIVQRVCGEFNVATALVALASGRTPLTPVVKIGAPAWSTEPANDQWQLEQTAVRPVQQRQQALHPLFHTCAWADLIVPLRTREETVGLWLLASPREGYFHAALIAFIEHTAATLAMGLEIVTLLDAAESLSRQIILVQEQEQRHFTAQLHDRPLQRLAAVRNRMALLQRELACVAGAATVANGAQPAAEPLGEIDAIAAELTRLEHELRDVYEGAALRVLEYGLEATIRELADQFHRQHALAIRCDITDLAQLSDEDADRLVRVVYQVVLEALNNVVKHTQATVVAIAACCTRDLFVLTVTNNGVVAPLPQMTPSALLRQRHFGIAGMLAWAKSVGGSLTIAAGKDATEVCLQVPLGHSSANPILATLLL